MLNHANSNGPPGGGTSRCSWAYLCHKGHATLLSSHVMAQSQICFTTMFQSTWFTYHLAYVSARYAFQVVQLQRKVALVFLFFSEQGYGSSSGQAYIQLGFDGPAHRNLGRSSVHSLTHNSDVNHADMSYSDLDSSCSIFSAY